MLKENYKSTPSHRQLDNGRWTFVFFNQLFRSSCRLSIRHPGLMARPHEVKENHTITNSLPCSTPTRWIKSDNGHCPGWTQSSAMFLTSWAGVVDWELKVRRFLNLSKSSELIMTYHWINGFYGSFLAQSHQSRTQASGARACQTKLGTVAHLTSLQ